MLLNTITIVPETPKVIKARNNENISPKVNNRKSMESDKKSPYFRSSNTIPTKSALIRSDQTISKPENGGVDYGEMTNLSGKRNPIEISSDESENESQDDPIDKRVTEFLNSSNLQDLQEYLKCSKDQALLIIGNRNYKHFDDVEDIQLRKMILKYREIIGQFEAVDNVIHHCDKVGREIEKVMLAWSEICAGDNTNIENLEFHCLTTQPKEINSNFRLKQYQLTGISWMLMLYSKRIGGILADEMGLGKSAQVIGFLSILTTRNSDNKYLIIVPSSTLENWMREIEQWSCNLKAICYAGSMKQRMELQYDIMEDSSVDVVLTTYNTATGNSVDRRFLRRMGFECLILDEGHMIKNDNSARSIHLSAFQIPFKMLITGTPIQNNLVELLTLLTFINPELFTSAQISFQSIFDLKSSVDGTLENKLALNRIQKANSILSPFVLRRKKQDVRNDIPPKTRIIEYIKLLPKQRSLYHEIMMRSKKEFVDKASKHDEPPKKKPKGNGPNRQQMNNIMMELRKVTNHYLLLSSVYTDEKKRKIATDIKKEVEFVDSKLDLIVEDLDCMSDFEIHKLCSKYKRVAQYKLTENQLLDSGKIRFLQTNLPKFKKQKDRVLIFSQFTIMLNILEEVLGILNINYLRLDGSTPQPERMALIDEFNENNEITVFLLSTKACGLGINLTSANIVILYDIDFNPHNDIQAEDRAHRVGQLQEVKVYKLITENTIEVHMLKSADFKLLLDQKVQGLNDGDLSKEEFVIDMLRNDMMNELE